MPRGRSYSAAPASSETESETESESDEDVPLPVTNEMLRQLAKERERRQKEKETPIKKTKPKKTKTKKTKTKEIPREFLCPISHELMIDPVINTAGQTYERKFIERWLKNKSWDPVTKEPITKWLIPNWAIISSIENWLMENDPEKRQNWLKDRKKVLQAQQMLMEPEPEPEPEPERPPDPIVMDQLLVPGTDDSPVIDDSQEVEHSQEVNALLSDEESDAVVEGSGDEGSDASGEQQVNDCVDCLRSDRVVGCQRCFTAPFLSPHSEEHIRELRQEESEALRRLESGIQSDISVYDILLYERYGMERAIQIHKKAFEREYKEGHFDEESGGSGRLYFNDWKRKEIALEEAERANKCAACRRGTLRVGVGAACGAAGGAVCGPAVVPESCGTSSDVVAGSACVCGALCVGGTGNDLNAKLCQGLQDKPLSVRLADQIPPDMDRGALKVNRNSKKKSKTKRKTKKKSKRKKTKKKRLKL
jgi:hypothetical protein